ncbi:unnamed protein product [Diamesa serratosioi]
MNPKYFDRLDYKVEKFNRLRFMRMNVISLQQKLFNPYAKHTNTSYPHPSPLLLFLLLLLHERDYVYR